MGCKTISMIRYWSDGLSGTSNKTIIHQTYFWYQDLEIFLIGSPSKWRSCNCSGAIKPHHPSQESGCYNCREGGHLSGASSHHHHLIISAVLATSDPGYHPNEILQPVSSWARWAQVALLTRRHLAPGDPWRIIVLLLNYKRGVYRDQVADILVINFQSLLPRWTQLKWRPKDYIKITISIHLFYHPPSLPVKQIWERDPGN